MLIAGGAVPQGGPHLTQQRLNNGTDKDVGFLERPPNVSMHRDHPPLVFLSCTGSDGTKEDIARPTHWFLFNVLGINTFFDEEDEENRGELNPVLLGRKAYGCTHAISILSPDYRMRTYCVRELNTFMTRRETLGEDDLRVLIVRWRDPDMTGYPQSVNDRSWINNPNLENSPVEFLTQELWPQLMGVLGVSPPYCWWWNTTFAMENLLARYVRQRQGLRYPIPVYFARFERRVRQSRKCLKCLCWFFLLVLFVLCMTHYLPRGGHGAAPFEQPTDSKAVPFKPNQTKEGANHSLPFPMQSYCSASHEVSENTLLKFGVYSAELHSGQKIFIAYAKDGIIEYYPDLGCGNKQPIKPSFYEGKLIWKTHIDLFGEKDCTVKKGEHRCMEQTSLTKFLLTTDSIICTLSIIPNQVALVSEC